MGIFRTLMAAFFFFGFFLCICGLGDTNTKKKLKKVRCFTGSGLFLIQMGLFTLYSATASVEQIKNVDIWGQFLMVLFFSNQRTSVPCMCAYQNPKPTATHKPVPNSEIKLSLQHCEENGRKNDPPMKIPGLISLILDLGNMERKQLLNKILNLQSPILEFLILHHLLKTFMIMNNHYYLEQRIL